VSQKSVPLEEVMPSLKGTIFLGYPVHEIGKIAFIFIIIIRFIFHLIFQNY